MTERKLINKEVDSIEKTLKTIQNQFFIDRIEPLPFNTVTVYTRQFIIKLQLKPGVKEAAYGEGALLPKGDIS